MKTTITASFVAVILLLTPTHTRAQGWEFPVIKGFGGVVSMPNSAEQPRQDLEYKILVDITGEGDDYSKPNHGLDRIARLINVYATAGVEPDQLEIVSVIHGTATRIVLSNDRYKKLYGVDNPNNDLVRQLKEVGVKFYVCGQALVSRDLDPAWVSSEYEVALSALTVVPTYQLLGYAMLEF